MGSGLRGGVVAGALLVGVATGVSSAGQIALRDVGAEAGLDFLHDRGARGDWHPMETMGSGVAVFDYDGDGALDLFFVEGGEVPGVGRPPARVGALYRGDGSGRFRDRSAEAGFADPTPAAGYGMGVVAADSDGDGDPDLFLSRAGPDLFYENRGDGTFALRDAGVEGDGWSAGAAFSDLDRDGDLDLYVTRYLDWSPRNNPECSRQVAGAPVRSYCLPDAFSGVPDRLYQNLGDGSFREIGEAAGIALPTGKGLGVLAGDWIGDALPDLLVANDTTPNFLFENRGGMRFAERGLPAGVAYDGDGNALAGMGVAAADIEPDGDLDLVVTNFQGEPNTLHVADRHGVFRDFSFLGGVGRPSLDRLGFGAVFRDLDLDGLPDLCFANGHVLPNAEVLFPGSTYRQEDLCFANRGGRFEPVPLDFGPAVGRGLAVGDLDGDGRTDLVVSRSGDRPALLRNESPLRPSASLRLVGRGSPRDGTGAMVRARRSERGSLSVVTAGSSYLSTSAREVVLPVPDERAGVVVVEWPAGGKQEIGRLTLGRYVVIEGVGVLRLRGR